MTEQQSPPEQMVTGEGAGERGGNYKVCGDGGDTLPVHVLGHCGVTNTRVLRGGNVTLGVPVPSEPPAAAVSRCVCHLPVIFPLGLQCVQLQEMEHCYGSLLGW